MLSLVSTVHTPHLLVSVSEARSKYPLVGNLDNIFSGMYCKGPVTFCYACDGCKLHVLVLGITEVPFGYDR